MSEDTRSKPATSESASAPGSVTMLLQAHRRGEPDAFDRVFELVYEDLRHLAHRQRGGGRQAVTLETTAIVHEAYLKLVRVGALAVNDRAHFMGIAAHAMRHIAVDHARHHLRLKRGGGAVRVDLEEADLAVENELEKQLGVDEALSQLRSEEPRLVRVVECRYFAGMTEQETAGPKCLLEKPTCLLNWIPYCIPFPPSTSCSW